MHSLSIGGKQLNSFKDGKQYSYEGAREVKDLKEFVESGFSKAEGAAVPRLPTALYVACSVLCSMSMLFLFVRQRMRVEAAPCRHDGKGFRQSREAADALVSRGLLVNVEAVSLWGTKNGRRSCST